MLFCSRCKQIIPLRWRICPVCYSIPDENLVENETLTESSSARVEYKDNTPAKSKQAFWKTLHEMGSKSWLSGRYDRALDFWEFSLILKPENYLAHFNLGTYYLVNRNLYAARYHLTRVKRIKPDYLAARVNLGSTYMLLGMLETARREYNFVIQHEPNHKGAMRGLNILAKLRSKHN